MFATGTLHPAFILRQNTKWSGVFAHDFARAVKLAEGTWRPKWDESELIYDNPSSSLIATVLGSMHGRDVTYDVETDGRHPLECSLRCVSFHDGQRGICVPFLYRDGTREERLDPETGKLKSYAVWKNRFSGEPLKRIMSAIRALAKSARRFGTQNGQYDRLVMKHQAGIEFPHGIPHVDSLVGHHIVAPYLRHNLGLLGSLYTEAPYYKATDSGDSWASESDLELYKYCCRDTSVTWKVIAKMFGTCENGKRWGRTDGQIAGEMAELSQNVALYEHDAWHEGECQRWKEKGITLDREALAFFRHHYRSISTRALTAIRDTVKRQAKSSKSSGHLDALLAKLEEKADAEVLAEDGTAKTVELYNPASLNQLRMMLQHLGVPLREQTATGELSTAKEFLTAARKEMLTAGIKAEDDRVAFLDYLFAWREAKKLDSTYLYPEILSDGRVHATFNVHIVPTGRLSSSGPNMTNQPSEIRGMYVPHDKKHSLVYGDWDALEMREGAFFSLDPKMVQMFTLYDAKKGPKPHIVNMSVIFGLPATKEAAEEHAGMYRAAKVFAYAAAYNAGEMTVFEQCREEMPDLSWESFKVAFGNYKRTYSKFFEWQANNIKMGTNRGWLESPFLRRRMYFFERAFGEQSPEASAMANAPFQCIRGSERVLTSVGYRKIESLPAEFDAWTGQRWAPATVIKKGTEPLWRVHLSNGNWIDVDATHRFLVQNRDDEETSEWRTTAQLKQGDELCLNVARPLDFVDTAPPSTVKSENVAWLTGFYMGNGWCNENRGDVNFVVGDSPTRAPWRKPDVVAPRIMVTLNSLGYVAKSNTEKGCFRITCYGQAGRDLTFDLKIDPSGKAKTKRVPEGVFSASRAERAAFLSGFLDADGAIDSSGSVSLRLCQEEILRDVMHVAHSCGVPSTLHGPYDADSKGHQLWVLCFNSSLLFQHVGWGVRRKMTAKGLLPNFVARRAVEGLKFPRRSSNAVIQSRINCGGSTSAYTILAMGGSDPHLYDFAKVTCVENLRIEEPVYTLRVEASEHRYVAAGIISKNSGGADIVSQANRRLIKDVVNPMRANLLSGERLEQFAQVHDELSFDVPDRFAEEFKKAAEHSTSQPLPGMSKSSNYPVEWKVAKRWKPVQTRCKCRQLVNVEPIARDKKFVTWAGKCSCGAAPRVQVPRELEN